MQEINYFAKLQELVKNIDYIAGTNLFFEQDIKQKTLKNHFLDWNLSLYFISFTTVLISTIIVGKYSLVSCILGGSIGIVCGVLHYVGLTVKQHKKNFKKFFTWFEKLNKISETFHPIIQKQAKIRIEKTQKFTYLMIKWMRIALYADAVFVTFGFAIIGFFLPEEIYPTWSQPVPLYLPFKEQNTPVCFFTTLAIVFKIGIDVGTFGSLFFGVFFCITLHILGFLDIIKNVVELLGREILVKSSLKGVKIVKPVEKNKSSCSKGESKVYVEILSTLNTNNDDHSLKEWIKIIVDMTVDVNDIITEFSDMFTGFFLYLQFASYGCLFVFGIVLLVVHQQYAFACGVTWIALLLFAICYINEKILEKLSLISDSLYNVAWYELTPTERKFILRAMNCTFIQKGFTAAKIYRLSLDHYANIIKAAYSNCLVLKDLIIKSGN